MEEVERVAHEKYKIIKEQMKMLTMKQSLS